MPKTSIKKNLKINNKKDPLNNFLFTLRKIDLINRSYLYVRNFRSRKLRQSRLGMSFRNFSKGRVILYLIMVLLVLFVFINVKKYFEVIPSPYIIEDTSAKIRQIYNPEEDLNVVYLGFDDLKNDYKFLDMIVITSLSTKTNELKTYAINPNFYDTLPEYKDFSLRTLLNNITESNDQKMEILLRAIESLAGIRIDRYIAFNYSDLNKIISMNGLSFASVDVKEVNNRVVSQGENLSGNDLVDYLINNKDYNDNVANRYVKFIDYYLQSFKSFFFFYKTFFNSSELLKVVNTNMTRNELGQYFIGLGSINSNIKFGFTSQNFNTNTPDYKGTELVPDFLQIDEDESKIFNKDDIVREQAKLEIYNGTEDDGLAYFKKREYEHLGATVVKFGNYPIEYDQSTLYIPKNNESDFYATIDMLERDLRGKIKIITGEYKYNYSGDMILVIGKDYLSDSSN